jgi:hypothetical protein
MANSIAEHNPVTGRDVVSLEVHCTGKQGEHTIYDRYAFTIMRMRVEAPSHATFHTPQHFIHQLMIHNHVRI